MPKKPATPELSLVPKVRKRRSRNTQPAWYKVQTIGADTYRIMEDDGPEAIVARILSITPATPQDFVQAGRDSVALESKPIAGAATDPAES